jgi:hypothetical protein
MGRCHLLAWIEQMIKSMQVTRNPTVSKRMTLGPFSLVWFVVIFTKAKKRLIMLLNEQFFHQNK